MTYKILITDDLSSQGVAQLEAADDIAFDVIKGLSAQELAERIPGYDGVIIRSSVEITKEVLDAADRLKVVGRAGVGVDNVDVPAASMRGIIVMNTPGANTVATAEHTMALLLALCRHVPQAYTRLKQGQWDRKRYIGSQLYRKTIGIIGMGRIGAQVARRCRAFGMNVLTHDPYLSDEIARDLKLKPVTLDELFAQSNFIALHAALTPGTKKIINADAISKMREGVQIVNTARGPLIDEEALIDGLRSGKIAAAALDVFNKEPLSPQSPLLEMDNVIVTPHLAASTIEAQHDVSAQVVMQMLNALKGVDFRNAINMPFSDANLLRGMQPFLNLAEKVGSLQTQLAAGAIKRVEVEIKGDEIGNHIKPITVGILVGILKQDLDKHVNYINAPHLIQRRGIAVSQTSGLHTLDYPNLITCRVEWAGGSRTIVATLFNNLEPRLVQIDGYRVDVRPEGMILVTHSHDKPGFIGQVGTLLGRHSINIATWRTGRDKPGGMAISFINVDGNVPQNVLDAIQNISLVKKAQTVEL